MIETVSLVDQYCHGVLRTELGLATFEAQLGGTARAPAPAPGTTFFDTQTGFAVRRWCPPLLGLEPHCPPARYLARRRELGVLETGRRLLRSTGISTYLVDTGLPGDLTGPAEIAATGAAEAHEIVRLEPLAERVADVSGGAGTFLAGLAESVHVAADSAVAFSSVAGARAGLAVSPEPPGAGEVRGAAGRWLAGRRAGGPLTDPVLLRHLLWTAIGSGLPLQLHAGGGFDTYPPDGHADPGALTGFAAATAGLGTDLVLLNGYPHHRHAAHLTSVFPHVYADLGPVLARTGAGAASVLAEILELAPFGKLLFSSGARGLPELHVVGAQVFREALERVLGGWVGDGAWALRDAQRVAGMIAAGNAHRLYGLPDAS
ncbi:amidohydrolase [Streptomyces scopuliridis]|uniref:Amidohydrolase n=1 Tax=Streptomyces scopuliridis RB72 TaxID=1440053 RepID=A0A2T7TCQ3_9ACTN|nr:amidohydrolase [Streptomyces scopuliridis]PVE12940.1 amidohydrolase [Streptomyces scopuliridis RB72]